MATSVVPRMPTVFSNSIAASTMLSAARAVRSVWVSDGSEFLLVELG
jgi:hypothetical protein